ncbi:MAG: hypothetical protein H5T86_11325 [Armatimonadetes bacterium]|nr:hypothetical protein [Armatimonadota bacterium]
MLVRERAIAVGETVFRVRVTWGRMRQYLREVAEAESADLSPAARELAIDEATRRFLADVVVGWDGPRDSDSAEEWRPDILDQFDPAVIAELVRKIAEPPEELGIKKGRSG